MPSAASTAEPAGLQALLLAARDRPQARLDAARAAGWPAVVAVSLAVPGERAEDIGTLFSSNREITHCYERHPPFEGRYNLFTMIHAGEGKLEGIIEKISKQAGNTDYQVLLSEEEFKKSSMEYF